MHPRWLGMGFQPSGHCRNRPNPNRLTGKQFFDHKVLRWQGGVLIFGMRKRFGESPLIVFSCKQNRKSQSCSIKKTWEQWICVIYYKSLIWMFRPFWGGIPESLTFYHHLRWPTGGKGRYKWWSNSQFWSWASPGMMKNHIHHSSPS